MENNIKTIKDGEFPFYQKEDVSDTVKKIPMGPGSNLDADTIQGLQAVTYKVAGPNKLVATNNSGVLPVSTMPGTSGSFSTGGHSFTITNGVITAIS